MMRRATLALLIALLTSPVLAADTYLDCTAGSDGTGAIGSPKNGTTTITSLSAGNDIYIAQGATCTGAAGVYGTDSAFVILNWSGTVADPVKIKTYDAGHGTTPPIFDSRETLTSWSNLAGTSEYYATTTVDDADALAVDDIGLQEMDESVRVYPDYTTDYVSGSYHHTFDNDDKVRLTGTLPPELSTGTDYYVRNYSGGSFQLSASAGGSAINFSTNGSGAIYVVRQLGYLNPNQFIQINSTDKVYVRTSDDSTPADNTVKISRTDNYIRNAWAAQLAYVYVEDLIYYKGASRYSVELGGWGGDQHLCKNCKLLKGDSKFTGGRGFSVNGDDAVLGVGAELTCSYASLMAGVDNACIVTTNSSRSEVANLTVTDTLGSCFELFNGNSKYSWGHDLLGTNCGHGGIEVYGCFNTTCEGSHDNLIERFKIDNTTRVTGVYGDAFSSGIGVGNNGFNNTFRNFEIVNVNWNPLSIRSSTPAAYQGHHNKFQNFTVYNSVSELSGSTAGALGDGTATDAASIQGGNIFENGIVYLAAGGRVVYDKAGKNIFRNNVYYTVGGSTQPFKWANTDYANMGAYTAVNTNDNSTWGDPLINTTTLIPAANSPAIGKGLTNVGVGEDYNGTVRSATNDAGAVQVSTDTSMSVMIGATKQ